ncbi:MULTISPECIES: ABC transporter substrate-binding protein [Fusobacterium]|jgi:branched-chain amino acid transport system substrate-binding protein|uniref:Amino acid-binding protein n=2 Tax=Fusobacterium mortiferum TaxID=850 RepID=A0A414PUV8_FUSMR|nr:MULTISPECIES: ABC transporter substrate-binding protein [Fusobacterium]AVQ19310.1 amino acid-binding protein [Fusobacterium mortiferum ATCC 9817]EEO36283.1 receptor family ligand-binding protein [Fusobacterium mortiferum ATCC 9817]MCF2628049.1 ABC transporter substrate-binding protein [Fusobacterium mortiferum]MCF2698634.1 ABC transporter substrate-binding protein [Fusobacterium mortiferum]MDD7262785.1 ABC transporter substrate-binding protein [Fusobacterium mortiferum]
MKKFTLMLLGLSFLITACGGEKEATTKKTDEAATIKIGGLGPLTGPLAIYGVTATNGSKLAFEEINKNGGILGKQVEFVLFDEKGDSTEAVTAYNRLVDEGVVALVGDITSKPSLAVAEIAAQDNMPMITPTGTQFNITEAGPNVFRVCFTDPYQGVILANLAKNNLKANTVAIMVNNSSDYSDGVAEAFIKEAERLGLKIVAKEGYAEGDKDFRAQLTKVAATNPDVLLVPDYYEQVALITTQAREVGVKSTFIGPDGWDGVAKALDSSAYGAVENSYFTNHYSVEDTNEKVQNFLKAYREKYKDEPSAFSALSYDAAYLMKDAIEKAGSTDKDAIVKAMKESDFAGVTGHLRFDEKNNPVKAVTVLKVVNGNYTFDSVIQPE